MSVWCVIPAKSHSQRFANKNTARLDGKPLAGWIIEAAVQSGVFDRVLCSTDSEHIADIAVLFGAEIPYIRPAYLNDGTSSEVAIHLLNYLRSDGLPESISVCLPTAPLTSPSDIQRAYDALISTDLPAAHTLAVLEYPPRRALIQHDTGQYMPVDDEGIYAQNSEGRPSYRITGGASFVKVQWLMEWRTYLAPIMGGVVVPRARAVDIDQEEDLVVAEGMLQWTKGEKILD